MAKLNILVVDDAAFIRDLVKKAVKEIYPGCTLHEAINGRKATAIMNSNEIHVVLCDWEMPEMSGLEVLQWMRSDERYKKTPFMMITSRGERDHVVKAVTAGVSDYIGKPFTRDNFTAKLSKMVYRHHKVKPGGAGGSSNPVNDSASVLTGGKAAQPAAKVQQDMGGASVLMGQSAAKSAPPAAPEAPAASSAPSAASVKVGKGNKAKAVASVRFGSGGSVKLVIKDISLQELVGVFRREGSLPGLLETVVVDIMLGEEQDEVARINGYIRTLQAQEAHPEAQTIQTVIRYVDDDPEKLAILSKFIARVR
ncbi:two-component system response regulator [Bacterioplanes sanyensis]|uniref:Two-component system response regulator n=1 Tax=Bacterioplanes sanyensis TaxID=1249553 RepID=A0A222FHG9_9GAMM|nr:response regulator [Bacterioplanes sanyensis]ASP38026.1 two-component system response regulator [Bacterioplanes sanyensis]